MGRMAFKGWSLTVAALLVGQTAFAGPITDYFQQKVETPGGYYEGQRRGYVTGGGFSARWRSNNDYLVSVEKPRLRAGCGGIDAFMGGFSFVKAEYLVQKLQQMAQNAPAVFLDLAITKMMQDLSNSMKSIDALTEALNNIQLNDCKATKAIIAGKPGEILDGGEQLASAWNDFRVTQGISTMYNDAKNTLAGNNGAQPDGDKPGPNSPGPLNACPADMDFIFLTPGTTIIGQMTAKKGYASDYADFMRGFLGDLTTVSVTNDAGAATINHVYVPPCQQNDQISIENLASGKVYVRPDPGPALAAGQSPPSCGLAKDANANVINWATVQIQGIRDAMTPGGSGLTAGQKAFIDSVPVPIEYAVLNGMQNKTDAIVVNELGQAVGRMYAYAAMRDFYIMMTTTIETAKNVVKGKAIYNPQCQVGRLQEPLQQVEAITISAWRNMSAMHGEYARSVAELNQSFEYAKHYEDQGAKAKKTAGNLVSR